MIGNCTITSAIVISDTNWGTFNGCHQLIL